jgi:hypothetical protein
MYSQTYFTLAKHGIFKYHSITLELKNTMFSNTLQVFIDSIRSLTHVPSTILFII